MVAKAYFRGHKTYYDGKDWRYVDDNEIAGFDGIIRPCKKCGRIFEGSNYGDADPCLGELPGVTSACCGHGVKSEAYICFENGLIIRGFDIEQEQNT